MGQSFRMPALGYPDCCIAQLPAQLYNDRSQASTIQRMSPYVWTEEMLNA